MVCGSIIKSEEGMCWGMIASVIMLTGFGEYIVSVVAQERT